MMHKPVPFTRGKIVIFYASMVLMVAFVLAINILVMNNTIDAAFEARQDAARAGIQPVCDYLYAQKAVYEETPPSTPTGVKLKESVNNLIVQFGCQAPPK
jgi:hypothetical protein